MRLLIDVDKLDIRHKFDFTFLFITYTLY